MLQTTQRRRRTKLLTNFVKIDAEEIVTSALATADFISEEHPNASVYMLGGNGLKTALTEAGLTVKANEHVVIGLMKKLHMRNLQ